MAVSRKLKIRFLVILGGRDRVSWIWRNDSDLHDFEGEKMVIEVFFFPMIFFCLFYSLGLKSSILGYSLQQIYNHYTIKNHRLS